MTGEILTLPLRITVRVTSLLLRGGEELATRGMAFASQAASVIRSRDESPAPEYEPPDHQEPPEYEEPPETDEAAQTPDETTPEHPEPETAPPPVQHAEEIDFDAPVEAEPVHVSEEPVLAAEVAEPGAEDGAGAQVRVDEPWSGYRKLSAQDIIARVSDADPAELAAIQLYESTTQGRQTVLSAVERQLALINRGS
jgi:hypothetical protein